MHKTLLKPCLLAAFVFSFVSLFSQATTFIVKLGTVTAAYAEEILVLPNGDIVLSGKTQSTRGFLAKFDNLGNMLWSGELPLGTYLYHLYPGNGSNFFACGRQDSVQTVPTTRAIVGYFDGNGQNVWLRQIDSGQPHDAGSGSKLANGNLLYAVGGFLNTNTLTYMATLDTLGDIIWERRLPLYARTSVAAFGQDRAFLTLEYSDQTGHLYALCKMNADGSFARCDTFVDPIRAVATYNDSIICLRALISGTTENIKVIQLDTLMNLQSSFDCSNAIKPTKMRFTPSGELLMSGNWFYSPTMIPDRYAGYTTYNPMTGVFAPRGWTFELAATITSLSETPDGGYVVALGRTNSWTNELILVKRNQLFRNTCDSISPASAPTTAVPTIFGSYPTIQSIPLSNSRMVPTFTLGPVNLEYQLNCLVGTESPMVLKLETWPNPTASSLNLAWNSTEMGPGKMQIQIWSSTGQMVLVTDLENDGAERINVETLANGCYHLRMIGEDNRLGRLTFVKQ